MCACVCLYVCVPEHVCVCMCVLWSEGLKVINSSMKQSFNPEDHDDEFDMQSMWHGLASNEVVLKLTYQVYYDNSSTQIYN